nr:PAS-domain containing protein [Azospirillum sp. SYSU D00513]
MTSLPYISAAAGAALLAGAGLANGPAPLVVGLGAVLSAAGLAGLHRADRARRRDGDRLCGDAARLEARLAAAPLPWCAWDAAGVSALSPDFAAGLGIPPAGREGADPLSPGDLAAAFAEPEPVARALERLRQAGEGFRMEARARDGRLLRLTGRRGAALNGDRGDGVRQDAVWLEDIGAEADAAAAAVTARDTAASALADLRSAADALPVPLWLRSADLTILWCNRAYARAVDGDPALAVAKQSELTADGAGRPLAQRARDGGFAQSERVPVVVGNERRLLEVTEAPLHGAAQATGGSGALVGYALDLTALEDLRAALKRHNDAQAAVLERLNTAIAIFGPDTRLTFFNQAYAQLWELDEAWLRTEPLHAEILEDLRANRRLPEYADYKSFKQERLSRYTRLIEPMEELLHLPDGTTLRALAAPHPLGGLMMIMEDVTNTLALESSYNTLIAVQQETLDNLAEGIAVFGGDGRLKLFNPAFARVWNLRDADLQGEPHIAEMVERMRPLLDGGSDWEELKDEMIGTTLERAVRSGRLERADGSVVEFATLPLPDGAVLNSYLDVTDSARLEQALRASNAALEAADQLKSEFIANVSHHLRTPLNGIIGFAEVLANQYFGELNPRQMEYVKGVLTAGERLLELIDDVVDLTSIGAGVDGLDRSTVDVPDLLDSVAGLTREWARREGLKLEVAAPGTLGVIDGDPKRLKQALFTLVVVAIRQHPPDGRILLTGEREGEFITLSVGGCPSLEEAHATARFDPTDQRASAALGLSVVRNVIELHGGRMEAEASVGGGNRIRCILPVTAPVL